MASRMDEYRAEAERCRQMAAEVISPLDKEAWLQLAAEWLAMTSITSDLAPRSKAKRRIRPHSGAVLACSADAESARRRRSLNNSVTRSRPDSGGLFS